jgi:probable O-glycosylation ligase (exosortase A-associated)
MIAVTLAGTLGVYAISPFWGVAVYYLFAALRPQFLWEWSLPQGVSWSYYVAVASIVAALGVILGVLRPRGEEGRPQPRWTFAHTSVLAFGIWVSITYFTAQHKEESYPWLIEYIKFMVMFLVATVLTRTVGHLWVLMLLTASSLAYIAYEVNFLYFVNNYLGIQRNGFGGLDNNGAGLMLAMGVPMCWFIYQGTDKWWRWVFVLLIPILVHAVLMTYSRGAMVSLLCMCPLLVLRSRRRLELCFFGLIMGVILIPTMAGPQIRARFLTLQAHEADESANSRRGSWAAAFRMASDYPIFGVGIRNANLFSHMYGADYEGRTIHSNYLQIAADNGFPGLALLLLMLATALYGTRRARRAVTGRDDPQVRRVAAIASGVECSLCVFCVGSIFLSMEFFELLYLLLFIAAQLPVLAGAAARGYGTPELQGAVGAAGAGGFSWGSAGAPYDNDGYPDHATL